MKRLFLALLALAFLSCAPIVVNGPTSTATLGIYAYDSPWNEVDIANLIANRIKSIIPHGMTRAMIARAEVAYTYGDAIAAIDAYNSANIDDKIVVKTEEVPITEAPTGNIYVTYKDLASYEKFENVPRSDMARLIELCKMDALTMPNRDGSGQFDPGFVFVDNIPPTPPAPPPLPTPKLWVALVDLTDGVIYFSEHYDTQADAQRRYSMGIYPEFELIKSGLSDPKYDPAHNWLPYLGETEYTLPL
jgi:hypothetical protein